MSIQVSDDEVNFLTQGDPEKEDVVLSLWHDKLKLLIVTDGEKGCRYFTKVLFLLGLLNYLRKHSLGENDLDCTIMFEYIILFEYRNSKEG